MPAFNNPRFLLDGMLGKMARWLRMLGIDGQYSPSMSDGDLLELAINQSLILVTKDADLARRARKMGAESIVLQSDTVAENIADIVARTGLSIETDPENSRCPKCGGSLSAISKKEAESRVPRRTFQVYDSFWRCQECNQTYWKGAHWTSITRQIREIERILNSRDQH